jgi:histidinol-phosphate aminotransferase
VLGDYVAGPSHVMPTGGTARFASPLNTLDFVRLTSVVYLDEATAATLSPTAARLADAEGLDGHAHAARLRTLENGTDKGAPAFQPQPAPFLARIQPYQPIVPFEVLSQRLGRRPADIVKLDANENPYGPSPKAQAALADGRYFHIYPDPESRSLRARLAAFTGVPADALLAGAGADELIDLVLRIVLEPGDVVVNCPPSFGMYPFSTAVNAGRLLEVPRRPDFSLDVAAIEAAVAAEPRARVLFLCSPNNPDGSTIGDEDLRHLLELPLLVVLDEAYVEFSAGAGRIGWVAGRENLVVLRTFSKWAGLAGLRVGYGAFPGRLAREMWKIKQPYNVNVAAAVAAEASLDDLDYLWANVSRLRQERDRLFAALQEIPCLRPFPSQANFVLCRVERGSAAELKEWLAGRGILVRHFDTPRLRNFIRISAGTQEQTDSLLKALREGTQLFPDEHR